MKQVYQIMLMEETAKHYVLTRSNVRQVALDFGISKSTVHKRLSRFLKIKHTSNEDVALAKEVEKLIEQNKAEKHLRGGETTRQKYNKIKQEKSNNNF